MYKSITEQWKDLAGKWRVRVALDDGNTIFLKFQKEPNEAEVQAETGKYIARNVVEKARLVTEAANKAIEVEKLELVKSITVADLKSRIEVKVSL